MAVNPNKLVIDVEHLKETFGIYETTNTTNTDTDIYTVTEKIKDLTDGKHVFIKFNAKNTLQHVQVIPDIATGTTAVPVLIGNDNDLKSGMIDIGIILELVYKNNNFYVIGSVTTATTDSYGQVMLVDNLTTDDSLLALSAKQGKVLKDQIGDLTKLETTSKTDLVTAINELQTGGGEVGLYEPETPSGDNKTVVQLIDKVSDEDVAPITTSDAVYLDATTTLKKYLQDNQHIDTDGTVKKIVLKSWTEYKQLQDQNQLDANTEYHIPGVYITTGQSRAAFAVEDSGSTSGGHIIVDNNGVEMTQKEKLQFKGASVTNETNRTVVSTLSSELVEGNIDISFEKDVWHEVTEMQNGWNNGIISNYFSLAYRKVNNHLEFRGVIRPGTMNETIFELPESYRPQKFCYPIALGKISENSINIASAVQITIGNDGVVKCFRASGDVTGTLIEVSFDGISIPLD